MQQLTRHDKRYRDELFVAEMIDLKQEIMTWGVLVPMMVVGYVGVVISYQRPFLENLDFRGPGSFLAAFAVGLLGAVVSGSHPRVALWFASLGIVAVTLLFCIAGQDGYTAVGVSFACGVVSLLLGLIPAVGATVFCIAGLAAYSALFTPLPISTGHLAAIAVASAFSVVLAHMVTRTLFRSLRWMQDNYAFARKQTDALSDKTSQLELALKSLSQTSFQLARANEQMEVAMNYAEQARQSKQQFAAAVSHELRAPLNLIIGFSDLIVNDPVAYENAQSSLPPKLLADIHVIHRHAQHLLKLVSDILDLSQLDVNFLTVRCVPQQIIDVVHSATDDYAELIQQRGLRLGVDVEPGLPDVAIDPTRIRQVLLNLLSNSVRSTFAGGIRVTARLSTGVGQPEGNRSRAEVVVSVHDTGSGISPTDLSRIFEPFVQVGAMPSQREGGSGLGLTICKRFVELHGGRMWVESTQGVGSTFSFSLPVSAEESPSLAHRLPHLVIRQEVGSLVVVENSSVLGRLMERHISGMPVRSVAALSDLGGMEAEMPEVILINAPSPHLVQELIPDAYGQIPVFNCYVHGALAFLEEGIDGRSTAKYEYLVKPVQRDQLYTTVSRMLKFRHDSPQNAKLTGTRSARILIVEDEDDAAYLLSRMLRLIPEDLLGGFDGVTICKARSGRQALEMLIPEAPGGGIGIDVVLLDLVLGEGSGFTVLAELERRSELRDIPVCVVTGQVASGDLLVTPYLGFTRKGGLSTRELAQAIVALTQIALPGVDVAVR